MFYNKLGLFYLVLLSIGVDSQQRRQYSKKSSLLNSFGCVERRNIFVITYFLDTYYNFEDDPCHTYFCYELNERGFVQCEHGRDEFKKETRLNDFMYNRRVRNTRGSKLNSMSNLEYMEVIENLCKQQFNDDSSIKQILLFQFTPLMDGNIVNALQAMNKETQWSIIVFCYTCPVIPGFPLHRIIPTITNSEFVNKARNLARNPNLKKMEFARSIKLDDKKLTHLANTTIHVADLFLLSLSLMEHAALISYNTQGMGTKIIIYQPGESNKDYWNSFMSNYPLLNSTIQIKYEFPDFCERFVGNEQQKSVVFVSPFYNYWFASELDKFKKCEDKNEGVHTIFNYYESYDKFWRNFIGDLLDKNSFQKNQAEITMDWLLQ